MKIKFPPLNTVTTRHYFLNQTKTTENKVLYPNKTILLVGIVYLDAQMNFIRTCTSKTK